MIQVLLGGFALGASLAALAEAAGKRPAAPRLRGMGQGVVTGPPGGGGFGGGGPGVVTGPGPSSGAGTGGATFSVHPGVAGPGFDGDFFDWGWWGYGWPYAQWPYYDPYYQPWPRPVRLVCREREIEGEDVILCQDVYPPGSVAWGPPPGLL